jgi:hypothetical protein
MMPKIPKTDSIQELATFWPRHDVIDFEDEVHCIKSVIRISTCPA